MDELLAARRADWQAVLDDMDLDGDGTLNREEIREAMCRCGHNPTDEEIESMFKEGAFDDGKITFEEYFAFIEDMPDPKESLREALDVFTEHAGEDGTISREKLREILMKGIPEEDANELLDAADVNGDGMIDKEEFITLLMNV